MSDDVHVQVREIIAAGEEKDLTAKRQTWLRTHLRECASCRDFAEMLGSVASALRAEPIMVDPALIRQTKERVQLRAAELRQQQERNLTVVLASVFITLSSLLTMPVCWRIAGWVGERVGVSNLTWQMGFGFFWVTPVLAASAFLLARDIDGNAHGENGR